MAFISSFITHPASLLSERSHSGLVHRSRKPEWVNAHRGFESHPLRHYHIGRLPVDDFRLWLAKHCLTNNQSAIGNRTSAISERCRSGLTGSTGNAVCGEPHRGFESHPFRHIEFEILNLEFVIV